MKRFKIGLAATLLALGLGCLPLSAAQDTASRASERYRTRYIQFTQQESEALLFEPASGATARIALVYTHPSGNAFGSPVGPEMAARGYRVLTVNYRGNGFVHEAAAPGISQAIAYLRGLPGVERVVLVGHSGGGHLVTFYQNVAENGPTACQGTAKIYPCAGAGLSNLARPDGLALLDPTLGAFHQMSALDPAVTGGARNTALDMFAPANGYDPSARSAAYSGAFVRRFHAGQAARNSALVAEAQARLRMIESGRGRYTDDEPLVIPGAGVNASGARLYQTDRRLLEHTRRPHSLLRADGSQVTEIIRSVRPPTGPRTLAVLRTLNGMSQNTTVRQFLAGSAIRTGPDYEISADNIRGVDWRSAITSTPANAEGVTVPALVLTMSCHYLLVPGEIIYDRLASRDKTYAVVEGATHLFTPCGPQYRDTVGRTFDYLDNWLRAGGRFQ